MKTQKQNIVSSMREINSLNFFSSSSFLFDSGRCEYHMTFDLGPRHQHVSLTDQSALCSFVCLSQVALSVPQSCLCWTQALGWGQGRGRSSAPPQSESLSPLEPGDGASCSTLAARPLGAAPRPCSTRTPSRKLMYLSARRRMSFLLSFLSGGCVGMRRRSSANAPFTFCCRQRSRLFEDTRRTRGGREPGEREGGSARVREQEEGTGSDVIRNVYSD